MAEMREIQGSRSLELSAQSGSETRIYKLLSFTSEIEALYYLLSNTPQAVNVGHLTLHEKKGSIEPDFHTDGKTLYQGTVTWTSVESAGGNGRDKDTRQPQEQSPTETPVFSFSYSSIEDVKLREKNQIMIKPNKPFINHFGFTGINQAYKNVAPQGVAIQKPVIDINVKVLIAQTTGTNNYFQDIFDRMWTTNEKEWMGLKPGSVALVGFESQQRNDLKWELDYTFKYRPPNLATTIEDNGNVFGVPEHPGWAYSWIRYDEISVETELDDDGNNTTEATKNIGRVFLTPLYPNTDFDELDLSGLNFGGPIRDYPNV